MKTLKLFNAVIEKKSTEKPYVSDLGFIIEPNASWAKDEIIKYYKSEKLNGDELNKTFHKSWAKIKNSSRFDLLIDQINHYISTYGSDFTDEVYIPNEVLDIPDVKLSYKIIKAYSKEEMIYKCLSLLKSGIALKEETINDLLTVLVDELDYTFDGYENIKNKEAIIKIADLYGVLPNDTMEFFRYIIYRSTGQSLLIKSDEVIEAIKNSNYNPSITFKNFGLEKLAQIFNRFKPLFLAFKNSCPKTINKISKLSKKHHKPLVENPLNKATSQLLSEKDIHWLDNATPYALFKVLQTCYTRKNGQDSFVYRIRNGKSWTQQNEDNAVNINQINFEFIKKYLKQRFDLTNKKIFLPKNVKYALPTSEKMFVGNIPTGTRFYGKKMAVGVYWENEWGTRDIDLSGINIGGKIGWNSTYNQNDGDLMFSGDMTHAPKGAVEYLYANNGLFEPTLINCSDFLNHGSYGYKIIIGKGDNINRNYMLNPNNLFVEIKTESTQNNMVLGIIIPKKDKQCFVLLNFGAGQTNVTSCNNLSNIATKALYQQWSKPYTFNKLIKYLGAEIVDKPELSDYNFDIDNLEKDSFNQIFQ